MDLSCGVHLLIGSKIGFRACLLLDLLICRFAGWLAGWPFVSFWLPSLAVWSVGFARRFFGLWELWLVWLVGWLVSLAGQVTLGLVLART